MMTVADLIKALKKLPADDTLIFLQPGKPLVGIDRIDRHMVGSKKIATVLYIRQFEIYELTDREEGDIK